MGINEALGINYFLLLLTIWYSNVPTLVIRY